MSIDVTDFEALRRQARRGLHLVPGAALVEPLPEAVAEATLALVPANGA